MPLCQRKSFHLHKFAWNSHIYLSIHYRIWTLNYPQLFSGVRGCLCIWNRWWLRGYKNITVWRKTPRPLRLYYQEHCVTVERELTFLEDIYRFFFFVKVLGRRLTLLSVTLSLLCDRWELQIICHTWVRIPFSFLHCNLVFDGHLPINPILTYILEQGISSDCWEKHHSPANHPFLCHFSHYIAIAEVGSMAQKHCNIITQLNNCLQKLTSFIQILIIKCLYHSF